MTLPVHLTPRTNQEAYDVAILQLNALESRSVMGTLIDGEEFCAYYGQNGDKCAIGAMIREDDYDPAIERCSLNDTSDMDHLLADGYLEVDERIDTMLLALLQEAHDCKENWGPDGFTNANVLRTIARTMKLSVSILDEIFGAPVLWHQKK